MYKEVLTDPRELDPTNFTFLVHGVMCEEGAPEREIRQRISRAIDPNRFYSASLIGRLSPKAAEERFGYREGEIDRQVIYGGMGVVIDILGDEVIYMASHKDLGVPMHPDELREYAMAHRGEIEDPLTLLAKKLDRVGEHPLRYNELVVRGHQDSRIRALVQCNEDPSEGDAKKSPYSRERSRLDEEGRLIGDVACDIAGEDLPLIDLPDPIMKRYREKQAQRRGLLDRIARVLWS